MMSCGVWSERYHVLYNAFNSNLRVEALYYTLFPENKQEKKKPLNTWEG